jgi:hypothetical protein
MGEPNQFRLQYRDNITNLINEVISNCMDKKAATLFVKEYAANEINHKDQARFIEVAETELLNMHEGNMARYRIRPSQFTNWRSNWR